NRSSTTRSGRRFCLPLFFFLHPTSDFRSLTSGISMTPREVLALCREKDVKAVDLRFTDLLGTSQHFTIPVGKLDEGVFEDGLGFDGSSLRGWQGIHESDMLVMPQPQTAFIDPFAAAPTLVLICNIQDPITGEPYSRDPRHIATK